MSIPTLFAQGKLRLSGVFNSVSVAGLQHLYIGLFPYHFVWSASNRIEHLADPGSFKPIGRPIQPVDFLGFVDEYPYPTKLISGQKQTGLSDAILNGRCRIGGTETVLAVLDFLPIASISRLRYSHKKSTLEGGLHLTGIK